MPLYCFTTKDGQTVERMFPMGECPEKVRVGGKVAKRDYQAESKGGMLPANWPMVSDMAFGYAPEQMAEVLKHDKESGLHGTEYKKVDGEYSPVFTNPHHRTRYCRAHGMFDRNAGYHDPMPNSR